LGLLKTNGDTGSSALPLKTWFNYLLPVGCQRQGLPNVLVRQSWIVEIKKHNLILRQGYGYYPGLGWILSKVKIAAQRHKSKSLDFPAVESV